MKNFQAYLEEARAERIDEGAKEQKAVAEKYAGCGAKMMKADGKCPSKTKYAAYCRKEMGDKYDEKMMGDMHKMMKASEKMMGDDMSEKAMKDKMMAKYATTFGTKHDEADDGDTSGVKANQGSDSSLGSPPNKNSSKAKAATTFGSKHDEADDGDTSGVKHSKGSKTSLGNPPKKNSTKSR